MKTSLIFCALVAACGSKKTVNSNSIKESDIYEVYSADYDEETRTLQVGAVFRVGGHLPSTVRLNPPSLVTFGDAPLELHDGELATSSQAGTFYKLAIHKERAPATITLNWVRSDQAGFRLTLPPIVQKRSNRWIYSNHKTIR